MPSKISYLNEVLILKSYADVALARLWLAARKVRGTDCRRARSGLNFADDKNKKSDYEN
jgi:hypothetical protein